MSVKAYLSRLTFSLLLFGTAMAQPGLPAWAQGPAPPGRACPIRDPNYQARLAARHLEGRVGRPVLIQIHLSPYPPPAGFFYTSGAEVLDAPPGARPEVLPGIPEIRVQCPRPGHYRLLVRVNLLAKTSCAGAKARIVLEEVVSLTITS